MYFSKRNSSKSDMPVASMRNQGRNLKGILLCFVREYLSLSGCGDESSASIGPTYGVIGEKSWTVEQLRQTLMKRRGKTARTSRLRRSEPPSISPHRGDLWPHQFCRIAIPWKKRLPLHRTPMMSLY